MPHEKGRLSPVTDAGAVTVTVDHRKALTITTAGKLDNLQIGNPLKIHKRKGLFDECVDADVAKRGKKHPKIHWTQLAANGASSVSAHRHNGRQTDEHDRNDSAMSEIKRRQVKVTLMDVLKTEEGQRYLSSCGSDTDAETQSSLKRGPRQRRSERGPSTVRRRASALRKDQTETTDTEESERDLSEGVRCTERFGSSPKQSDEEESRSPSEERHNLLPKDTESLDAADNELCPVEESDSSRPASVSPVCSEEADSEHISESLITATRTPTQAKQPSGFDRTEYRDSESEAVPTQQKTSTNEARECADVTGEEEGEIEQEREEEEALQQNGEVLDEGGGARGSVLRLSTGAAEGQLADDEVTPSSSQMPGSADKHVGDSQLVEVRQAAKPQTIEPIVLSSEEEEEEVQEEVEEEEEDGGTLHVQALEGAEDPRRQQKPVSSFGDSVLSGCSVMELQFSALYMGSLSALTNGRVKITEDTITISCKEPSGSGVKTSLATEHVRKYSVWDGLLVQGCRIAKEHDVPPPSVLLIWLDEVQARRLSSDLSVLLPGTRPAEGSTCVVLCVSEPLNGVQGALLASIMDIVGLRHGNTELLTPHTHPDSLKILQNSPDSHMLQLLLPAASCESETAPAPAPAPASATTASAKDSDVQPDSSVYTLCQSRGQSAYRVSLAHKPGADWTPYRHCGPARRLIQFPPPPSKGAITVTTEDLECLDSGEFLNDVIIDFYLKYLLVKKAPHASVRRSHVFSSFFYKQLTRRDNANEDSTSTPAQLRRHQRVRTWTRHVDIFEKDFLFVPVNQEAHWYLVVVCFPGLDEPQYVERGDHASAHVETENSDDTTGQSESQHGDGDTHSGENSSRSVSALAPPTCTESTCKRRTVCKRPCILIMDSLKVSVHERIFKLLREYLQAEWEVKRGGHRDFSAERMVGSHCRVPLQDNSSDCGLYLLQYAESFLQDPVVHFDLPLKLECWFPRQKVREKREEIRNLVLHLYRFQQGSLGNDSSDDGKEIGNIV